MAALLAKFRIDFSDVIVIPDITKKALPETQTEYQKMIGQCAEPIPEEEMLAHKEKTNRNLRLTELLRQHSLDAEMIIMCVSAGLFWKLTSDLLVVFFNFPGLSLFPGRAVPPCT